MYRRFFLLMSVLLLGNGCHRTPEVEAPIHGHEQIRPMASFGQVYVNGKFNVNLHTGYSHPAVILHGDPRDLTHVVTKVVSGILTITISRGYPLYGPILLDIHSSYLNAFEYHGQGMITGTKLNSGLLDLLIDNKGNTTLNGHISLRKLNAKGQGNITISGINSPYLELHLAGKTKVRLNGMANIASLDMKDSPRLSLFWVKSRELIIRARGKGFIQLAGIVNKLDVELWGESYFNGRYLRAKRSYVKTNDKSVADISTVSRQHTLANDKSDIHFYNIPTLKADFMGNEGAVLDMRDLGFRFDQEYTQYNK